MTGGACTGPLVHGIASRAAPGECESGDRAVVAAFGDRTLLAVIDGLGHGPDAAVAADAAASVLTAQAGDHPTGLLRRCHAALRHTRGAAMSVATVSTSGCLEWVAVGNVQGAVVHARTGATTRLVNRGGVVGLRLPVLRAATVPLEPRDLLVLFTDGVEETAVRDLPASGSPQTIADRLFGGNAVRADDALLLVARYRGAAP